MRVIQKILIWLLVLIVALPVAGSVAWYVKRGHQLSVLVINKSGEPFRHSENHSLNWILNHLKIYDPDKQLYDLSVDYYGTHINGEDLAILYPRLHEAEEIVSASDLVYYAENASGSGLNQEEPGGLPPGKINPFAGSLNNVDYYISRKAFETGKPVIAEYNFFGTSTEPLMRYHIEELMDVYWLGWDGKAVEDLDSIHYLDGSGSWKQWYTRNTGRAWDFSGPGIILVDSRNQRILVLVDGKDIDLSNGLIFAGNEGMEKYHLPASVSFHGWFSVVHPGKNRVLARFDLHPTVAGMAKLRANGLTGSFPALINGDPSFYFLAGDFGKSPQNIYFPRVLWIDRLTVQFRKGLPGGEDKDFYYTFYRPLVSRIIKDIMQEQNRDNK